ncbi:prephenate dehydratase [Xanthocytophaga flava]|uniref:prephenate dehydratase n=1 Tax=Xanthocytophaga flava TaxID=3048013 RepID=UPI0028D1B0C4|nr:prephenate dehydratase [Xanthocytophaga flavus]MDJ1470938.1 prephenate dehydratase [Xanthocytophaga flavus]
MQTDSVETELLKLRYTIDSLDEQILHLLNQRLDVVKKVGELKRANNSIIYRPEREKSIVDRLTQLNSGLLTRPAIEAIFQEIFAVARNIELPERIAYLGPEGSFTHQAAESRFGAISEYMAMGSIRSVFESVETERARFGIVPIENNQEGSVIETIDLLSEKDVKIVAEILMPIHFTFASKCDKLTDIRRIYSKDIAFRQCQKFLTDYFEGISVEYIPVESTSKAARKISEEPNSAAICSHIAAKLYNIPILFNNIEDSQSNATRFFIIGKNFVNQRSGNDKTTFVVNLPDSDKPGSLFHFLEEFNKRNINITKIDSRPVRNKGKFQSWFYLDFDGHIDDQSVHDIYTLHRQHIKWVGSYVKLG